MGVLDDVTKLLINAQDRGGNVRTAAPPTYNAFDKTDYNKPIFEQELYHFYDVRTGQKGSRPFEELPDGQSEPPPWDELRATHTKMLPPGNPHIIQWLMTLENLKGKTYTKTIYDVDACQAATTARDLYGVFPAGDTPYWPTSHPLQGHILSIAAAGSDAGKYKAIPIHEASQQGMTHFETVPIPSPPFIPKTDPLKRTQPLKRKRSTLDSELGDLAMSIDLTPLDDYGLTPVEDDIFMNFPA